MQSRLKWQHEKLNVIRASGALGNICCLFWINFHTRLRTGIRKHFFLWSISFVCTRIRWPSNHRMWIKVFLYGLWFRASFNLLMRRWKLDQYFSSVEMNIVTENDVSPEIESASIKRGALRQDKIQFADVTDHKTFGFPFFLKLNIPHYMCFITIINSPSSKQLPITHVSQMRRFEFHFISFVNFICVVKMDICVTHGNALLGEINLCDGECGIRTSHRWTKYEHLVSIFSLNLPIV